MADRNNMKTCPDCGAVSGMRDVSQELPNMLGTEKKFNPYFDLGVGKQINTRAEQQREWGAKGLVGLTRREMLDQFDRGMRQPVKPRDEETQKKKWREAVVKGARRVYEKRKIVVSTA
jgi:hypothetical protein